MILQQCSDSEKISKLLNFSDQHQHNNITLSLDFAKKAFDLAASMKDTALMGRANLKTAELYLLKGLYDKSLAFVLNACRQFEKTGQEDDIAYCCEILGKIYSAIDEPGRAVEYYNKAVDFYKKLDLVADVARNYASIGEVFVSTDSIDKGLSYYLVSLMIIDSLKLDSEKNDLLIRVGDGYLKLQKYEESLKSYYQAMDLAEKSNNLYLLAQVKSRIGKAYFHMNNMPAALKYSRESLLHAGEIKTFRIKAESYKNIANIYATLNNHTKAFEYYIHYKEASDSLMNEEKLKQIGELQAKYDIAQKEKENEWLKQQNTHKTTTIKRITRAVIIIIFLFILTLIQLVMLIRLNKRTRHLNLKLAKQGKELEELNDQKDKFFSFVAHNLKNPFTTIMGFSELIVKSIDAKDYDKIDRYGKHILGLSVHVHKILDNLLEWSRLQRRSFEYKPEKTDLAALIRDVLEMNQKEAQRKAIEISHNLPEDLFAFTDRFMITTVLQNLMSNALNFTPSAGKIHVSVEKTGPQVKISVNDTGIGIAPEDIPKLFRIDTRPAKIGTAESRGSGLGLVICRELIQRCQGEITIDSKLSQGTTVTLTLSVNKDNQHIAGDEEMPQPDVMQKFHHDMERMVKMPEDLIRYCSSSLTPAYHEVRSVLSLDNLAVFARDVENAGQQYNILSFVSFGQYLKILVKTHQIDKILRFLPEFKKMTDAITT